MSEAVMEPCPICQGNGTRGQMLDGNRMAVIECEVCGGTGELPVFDDEAFEAAKDRASAQMSQQISNVAAQLASGDFEDITEREDHE